MRCRSRAHSDGRCFAARQRALLRGEPRRGGGRPTSKATWMSTIVLDGVSKVFAGGVHAVNDIDLTIASGEFMVLVGPSGCGKTTLLRMIAGLEEVTGGTISIGDRDATHL